LYPVVVFFFFYLLYFLAYGQFGTDFNGIRASDLKLRLMFRFQAG